MDFNKICAKHLGWIYITWQQSRDYKINPGWYRELHLYNYPHNNHINKRYYICRNHIQLNFNSDWNRIMEVFDSIDDYEIEISNKKIMFYHNDLYFESLVENKNKLFALKDILTRYFETIQ